ncbi:LOG family protein [Entomomonas asaccharolytica]|uniref:Cytokinin riboside 5'-monophosphate phosphoribohydrolase n=1 Tax=Entomomonas asaccharolytica TaxID=2785331 RepID=A0A974RW12_9GAMM|nr:TIGR00730 family Rossman fold protein [Entomomonas asaccharolytica]QQP84710.1 TIGR00730 family Rossman fold protein [Entomomonas asaccharolytica]
MQRICVFCGSNTGNNPIYIEQAKQLGTTLANHNITLIYGGTTIGLMGAIADAALAAGGKVIGIIPQRLADKPNMAHAKLTDIYIVESMHQRKAKMAELADGFIALPGGLGTFEELFEMLTWSQLDFHKKPCAVLNINGFYDKLTEFLDSVIAAQFMKPEHRQLLISESNPEQLLEKMQNYQAPTVSKWFNPPI